MNRDSDLFKQSQKLFQFIKVTKNITFLVTKPNFNKAIEYLKLSQKPSAKLESITAQISSFFCIVDGTTEVFNKALCYEDFEIGFEIECFFSLNVNAIVTQNPQKYKYKEKQDFPIWSVDELIKRSLLESAFKADYNSFQNIDSQLSCLQLQFQLRQNYLIRNTINVIISACSILQFYGYNGLAVDEFQKRLNKSDGTGKRIIWDLENFNIAYRSGKRIYLSQYLLDAGVDDIAKHIYKILQNHHVVQQIYHRLENEKFITRWGVGEIINEVLKCQVISKSSLKDYSCRFLSWFTFSGILEESRGKKDYFLIPRDNKKQNRIFLEQGCQQLELPFSTVV